MRYPLRHSVLLSVLLLPALALAELDNASSDCVEGAPETTPSAAFAVVEEGVVRHERTGLEWQRCPLGMEWNESTASCDDASGVDNEYNWQDALQAADAESGWRLPNINELRSIVELCREEPTINTEAFPGTPNERFWSASPTASDSDNAWMLRFADLTPKEGSALKSASLWVRLVRDGS